MKSAIAFALLSALLATPAAAQSGEPKAELAKLDEEIAEIEEREQQLVDEARAAGIRI